MGIEFDLANPAIGDLLQGALDHRDETARVEWLGDCIERPGLLHELAADLVALRAHEHDRQVLQLRVGAHLAAELVAVHPRHHEVEQHQIDVALAEPSRPACPSAAVVGSYWCRSSMALTSLRIVGLSSTTRTRAPIRTE